MTTWRVSDPVVVLADANGIGGGTFTVASVGRKWFTITQYGRSRKFSLEDGYEQGDGLLSSVSTKGFQMPRQSADDARLLMQAAELAARRHHGQTRVPGVPYVLHCFEVAELLTRLADVDDAMVLSAAILHDVVEDTDTKLSEIDRVFGERVGQLVGWLTLPQDCRHYRAKHAHQMQMMQEMDDAGRLIKIADKTSNVGGFVHSPPAWSRKAILGYATSAREVVHAAPLWILEGPLVAHFESVYAMVIRLPSR
jgi:guanosine-3',5'-bis(diphosphate) 3'-pyrophosphohydrolase